jgi:hypothetical protein
MSIFKTEWTEERIRFWRATQEMGRDRWVMTHSVMGWGTTMFLVSTAVSLIWGESEAHLKAHLIIGMIVWPIAGLVVGISSWTRTEHSYQKHVERRVF